jgi:hypothetical protein
VVIDEWPVELQSTLLRHTAATMPEGGMSLVKLLEAYIA